MHNMVKIVFFYIEVVDACYNKIKYKCKYIFKLLNKKNLTNCAAVFSEAESVIRLFTLIFCCLSSVKIFL